MKVSQMGLALLLSTALIFPAAAFDLSHKNDKRSGISVSIDRSGVSANVGDSLSADVKTRDGITVEATLGHTTAKGDLLGSSGVVKANVKSALIGGIDAKLVALSR
jgi:hypothetical protein